MHVHICAKDDCSIFILLGNPGPIGNISYRVSSLNSSMDHVYVFSEWEYKHGIETVKNFVAETNTTTDQLTVPSNVKSASFVIPKTQMSRSMASLTVTAVGHCGMNETKSIDIQLSSKALQFKFFVELNVY